MLEHVKLTVEVKQRKLNNEKISQALTDRGKPQQILSTHIFGMTYVGNLSWQM